MIAVAYIRCSSIGQLDGDGPERQSEHIAKYAAEHSLTIDCEFVEAVSGTKDSSNRPVFTEMLAYCVDNGIDTVLVEKSDRFSRDMFVGLALIIKCQGDGISVIDCEGNKILTKADTPEAVFINHVLLAAAEYNKSSLLLNMNKAQKRIRDRTGKCSGRKGYYDDPTFPQGPVIVARGRELVDAGHTYKEAAQILNDEGWTTIEGKAWKFNSLHRVLNEQRCIGGAA